MSWARVKLGDIAEFSNGLNFGKEAYSKGIKLIGVSNFENRFYPDYKELEEVKENIVRPNDLLVDGDIVFVRSNGNKELVGRCMLIQNPPAKITFSGFCIKARLKDLENHDPVFWTYHFKNQGFRRTMSGTAIGANIQNLSQGRLAVYEAEVPDIGTQHRIANVLSTYDKLIHNNEKQIKLLEEAAQRLYKEWFVDLRFPGYENCKIVDGVPEGWKSVSISDIADLKAGGDKPKDFVNTLTNECTIPVFANGITDKGLMGFTNKPAITKPSVTISARGTVGVVFLRREPFTPIVRLISVTPNEKKMDIFYLYLYLKNQRFRSTGAAQQQITVPLLKNKTIICPEEGIRKKFEIYSKTIFDKIQSLEKQTRKLIEARDRLLPMLMNGEIEV